MAEAHSGSDSSASSEGFAVLPEQRMQAAAAPPDAAALENALAAPPAQPQQAEQHYYQAHAPPPPPQQVPRYHQLLPGQLAGAEVLHQHGQHLPPASPLPPQAAAHAVGTAPPQAWTPAAVTSKRSRQSVALRLPQRKRASASSNAAGGSASVSVAATPQPGSPSGSSNSVNMPTSLMHMGASEAVLAPNVVTDSALDAVGACAALVPIGAAASDDEDEGTVYQVTHGGRTRRVVLTGDMDDDLDAIAELEEELGVPLTVHGLQEPAAGGATLAALGRAGAAAQPAGSGTAVRGNPVGPLEADCISEALSQARRGAPQLGAREGAAVTPSLATRQARREAAGVTCDSLAGASTTCGLPPQHSMDGAAQSQLAHSGAARQSDQLHDPMADAAPHLSRGVSRASQDVAPPFVPQSRPDSAAAAAAAAAAGAAQGVPKLALAGVDVARLRADAEAEGEAVQGESLLVPPRRSTPPPHMAAGGDSAAASPSDSRHTSYTQLPADMAGPLSAFEDATIHAHRGATYKSQAAFLRHMRLQEDAAAAHDPALAADPAAPPPEPLLPPRDVTASPPHGADGGAGAGSVTMAPPPRAASAGGGSRALDEEAEAASRLLYRVPDVHVAVLTLVLHLLLTAVRPSLAFRAWSRRWCSPHSGMPI